MKLSISPNTEEIYNWNSHYVGKDKDNLKEVYITYDYEGARKKEKVQIESFSDEGIVVRWKAKTLMRILYKSNIEIEDLEKSVDNR